MTNTNSDSTAATEDSQQALAERVNNRSHRPSSDAFRKFMASNWGERIPLDLKQSGAAAFLPARHEAIGSVFPGDRLVVPAGTLKTRSNDTDYRFRPHSAFAHLTGLEAEMEPDAVLVLNPTEDGAHEATLYFVPRASRTSEEFYSDSRYGEFWVGARPTLSEMEGATGLRCAPLDTLKDALAKDADSVQIRVITGVDAQVDAMVQEVRQQAGASQGADVEAADDALAEALSEMRLIKDQYEVEQMQAAVDATKKGFESIIRELPRTIGHPRGERVIEGAFAAVAREYGNGLGYETIAASGNHANTLHWMDNSGAVQSDDLVLVDAGVELDSLYTADITRTMPISGTFTAPQKRVYEAVLAAAEAGLAEAAKEGVRFRDIHEAAQKVLAKYLADWGILPVSVEESLSPEGQQHRRWMPHGTCHHLGLDVHDCAQARRELYQDALLEPGMIFTIEPGLYFRADDLSVPAEFRGIGVRIEDDILIQEDRSPRRLSESIPRTVEGVEQWMAEVQSR